MAYFKSYTFRLLEAFWQTTLLPLDRSFILLEQFTQKPSLFVKLNTANDANWQALYNWGLKQNQMKEICC